MATITYAGAPYCLNGTTATVTQTGIGGGAYSAPAGVAIDAVTGTIDLPSSTPGTYTITYSFSNGVCSNTATTSVTINALPVATVFYPGSPYCATGTATATQTGQAGGTYSAPAGVSINAASGDINLGASTSGVYTITYSFSNGVCSNTTTTVVTINAVPALVINNPAAVCTPSTVDLTAAAITAGSSAGLSYTYFTDAAGTIVLANANAINASGTYYIRGTNASGCSDIKPVTVVVNPKPAVVIANPAAVCAPATVNLTAAAITAGSTPGLTYTYFTDAAGTLLLANANAVNSSGTYYIRGTNVSGCSDIQPVTVTVNPLPLALIQYTGTPYCTNGTAIVTLTGIGGGVFSSAAGLSLNTTTGDINLAFSAQGTYTVTYNFTNGSCSNSTSTVVTIKNPTLLVTDPAGVCFPATVDLTDPAVTAGSQAGLTYNYYTDAAGTNPLLNPSAVSTPGTYYIRGTNTLTGCSSFIMPVNVNIFTKPSITASSSATDICKGSMITLTAVSPGNTIDWPGLGTGAVVTATPMADTTYMAIATTNNGCMDTATVSITVKPFTITLTANPDPVLAGTNTTLMTTANFPYSVLSWTPAVYFTDQTATIQNIVVKDTSKSFTVIGQSTDGCLDTATLYVTVDPNLKDFFIPNSFSPNGDGVNDIFKIYGSSVKDVTLRVYNQWGELIFEGKDSQGGWDGTWKGRPQDVGVYVYIAQVTFYNNVSMKRKGTINLIR